MKIKLNKVIPIMLSAVVLMSSTMSIIGAPVANALVVEKKAKSIEGHQFIAENEVLEMYLETPSLSIIMRNKSNGALMYSTVSEADETSNAAWQSFMQSGIVMEYIKGTNVNVNKADLFGANTSIEVETTQRGFTAHIAHSDIGISYDFEVTLTEDGFTAEVKEASIVEESDDYKVAGFYMYPFLGYAEEGDREGYMFIPDGSGALINLEYNHGKYKQPFSVWIFGDNIGVDEPSVPSLFNEMSILNKAENIVAPVFGMVHTDSEIGVLGIVEGGGEYSAKIEAYPNGAITKYDWITAHFIYRQVYNQATSKSSGTVVVRQKEMNHFDARVRYKFVAGQEANYTGLAKAYREHLIGNGELATLEDEFKVRIDFLGAEQENWLLFKKTIPMTTTEDISGIYEDLAAEGVHQILSVYKGWQAGGISAANLSSGFKVESALGGNKGVQKLLADAVDTKREIYLANDGLRVNPNQSGFNQSIVKKLNKKVYEEETYKEVFSVYHYMTPTRTAEILQRNLKKFSKKDVENILLTGISNTLFSYNFKGTIFDRIATAKNYESIINTYSKETNLILEQPFSYLWKYSKAMIDLPVQSSNYIFSDEEIPFLAIVLKGSVPMYSEYINFEANKQEYFLKLVEQGVYPSFYITKEDPAALLHTNSSGIYSSRYDLYKDEIVSYYNELKAVNELTKGATIESHEKIGEVVKVTYSNDCVVYVNYGKQDKQVGNNIIPAKSYKVGDTQ